MGTPGCPDTEAQTLAVGLSLLYRYHVNFLSSYLRRVCFGGVCMIILEAGDGLFMISELEKNDLLVGQTHWALWYWFILNVGLCFVISEFLLLLWSHFLGPKAALYVPSRFPWHLPIG